MKVQHQIATIRLGTDEDAEFFFDLEEQTTWDNLPCACGTPWDRDQIRESLCATHRAMLDLPGNILFIAEADGVRAGMLWFGNRRNLITGEDEGWVYNVTVLPHFRRRGIARILLHHVEEYARAEGYRVLGLSVAVHNEQAQRLYQEIGYEESNVLMRKLI